jgi:Zn-dependent metalloprotease
MNFFKGEKKEKKEKSRLSENLQVTKNKLTKIPDRVTGIDTYPNVLKKGTVPLTKDNVEATFKKFLTEHKKIFEVDSKNLKLVSAKNINRRWYIKYGQYYKGIPVYDTIVTLESSENGQISSYAANYQPDISVPTDPKVSLEEAVDAAKKTYPDQDSKRLEKRDSILVIYPENAEGRVLHHLAWKFMLAGEQTDPEIEKYFIVDAIDGKIIRSYTARFPGAQVTGTVRGEIYPTNPTDAISTMPIRHGLVEIDHAGSTTTNYSGSYAKHVPWWWELIFFKHATFKLEGPYARVQNFDGTAYTVTKACDTNNPCDLTWTATDRDHINLFYHMNLFHDWLESELGYSWVNLDGTTRFNAQVNHNFSNAYAGNPMTFGNDNFARSSDVICHECTHNILYHEYGNYIGWPDATTEAYAMDEGFADYFASSFTNESRHGEGYTSNPRNLQNTRQYPGKNSYNIEGHTGGMIIAGAAWDFRQRLINNHGAPGARIADELILEAHQILSAYPRKYYFSDPHESNLLSALYKAVDIDNNLLNGFPYFNDIQQAFHAHSLLQVILDDEDSFDFSTNTVGNVTGGDLYYYQGKFWANNLHQKGVVDLGNIGSADLATVNIPTSGFTRFGVTAVADHTYVSIAQEGETASYIIFRVTGISADKSTVTLRYLYRFNPDWHVANLNSKEIHKMDCHWVSLMAASNKSFCKDLGEVAKLIKESGYNGCHYCLPRYDTDTLSVNQVIHNLDDDLAT